MVFLPFKISGIPCLIRISYYVRVRPWRGSAQTCPSSDDYYGYTDCDWEVCDRKGYLAPWLGKKLTPYEKDLIAELIYNHYNTPEEP